jgi:cyclic pyranopterin phosphate synthase
MPNDFAAWLPSEHQLTTDELVRVIEIAVSEGINEVRLTGGEPLLRPDIVEIVSRINAITNAPTLTMTTNALTLEKVAKPLVDAGLTRINISLDTLDRDRFKLMTHRDRIDDVFAGIKAAQDAGINPIKINAVLLKGVNADEAFGTCNSR